MTDTAYPSAEAKDQILFEGVCAAVLWLSWPFIWYAFGVWAQAFAPFALMLLARYSSGQRTKLKDEIEAAPLAFKAYSLKVGLWLFWVITIPQIALCFFFRHPFVWAMSGLFLLVGGVILLAKWQEIADLRKNPPNQALQHNAGSRPSSMDSSATEAPPSLGPRG